MPATDGFVVFNGMFYFFRCCFLVSRHFFFPLSISFFQRLLVSRFFSYFLVFCLGISASFFTALILLIFTFVSMLISFSFKFISFCVLSFFFLSVL